MSIAVSMIRLAKQACSGAMSSIRSNRFPRTQMVRLAVGAMIHGRLNCGFVFVQREKLL